MIQAASTLGPGAAGEKKAKTEVFCVVLLHKGKVAVQEDDSREFGKIVKPFSKSLTPDPNYDSIKMEKKVFQELLKFHLGGIKLENLTNPQIIRYPVKAKKGITKNFHVLFVAENNFNKFNGTFNFADLEKLKKINCKKTETKINIHGTLRGITPGFKTALFLYRQ